MEAAFGAAHEVTDLFKQSVMNGSYWVDLRQTGQVSISNLYTVVEGIANDPIHSAGFGDLDSEFQTGLSERVSELQQQLAQLLNISGGDIKYD